MVNDLHESIVEYYRHCSVQRRMSEFVGGASAEPASAVYIVGTDGYSDFTRPLPPACLGQCLKSGLDVERSLWDRRYLIADLDVEYENFDSPAAPYLNPGRAFALVEPVLQATQDVLSPYRVGLSTLISGRGFHLVWGIAQDSEAFRRLASLGQVPFSMATRYMSQGVESSLGSAFAGLGMVLEFVGHRVQEAAAPRCGVPIQLTAIEVGPGSQGREIISFDVSEYGDPLHLRHIRIPFSVYLKPRKLVWALGETGVHAIPPLFEIPLAAMTLERAIHVMRNAEEVLKLSRHTSVQIPESSGPMEALISDYERSALAVFHRWFYSTARTSERLIPGDVPPCMQWLLDHPNDWLLKPAALQYVVRILTSLGWHPRSIAELICSRYQSDCGWGDYWTRQDAVNRAIFYTRLFTGLIATGRDRLIDLNCVSHREKGFCMIPDCSYNLACYKERFERRQQ